MNARDIVESAYLKWKGVVPEMMTLLPRSGSERVYFRLTENNTFIIGVFNPCKEENDAFVGFTDHFRKARLKVPEVYVYYPDEKVYFLEDLGETNLFTWLALRPESNRFDKETEELFATIVEDLVRFQTEGIRDLNLALCYPHRSFDKQSMMWDMNYFKYMFLKLVSVPFNETRLERDFERLTGILLSAGQDYFLFRDFQSANIMIRHGVPYYIDYQGGRCGAPQYDIASLVYDSKVSVPPPLREKLIDLHAREFHNATRKKISEIRKYSDAYAAVRLMQALGAFGYRGLFENKPTFTESIVPAVELLSEVLIKLTETIDLPELSEAVKLIPDQRRYKMLKRGNEHLKINVSSFSYVQGKTINSDNGGGFVFDCRGLKDPHDNAELRMLNGKDAQVSEFMSNDEEAINFVIDCVNTVRNSLPLFRRKGVPAVNVAFGCAGGQHRSVWCAEKASALLAKNKGAEVIVKHRELGE
jgi:aminoglycoside/choline kinase family phosphotransferase